MVAAPPVVATEKKPALEAVARRVTEMSTLPQVALQVLEVARDPESGAADLTNVVEGDPSLSARVIRIVNSAAYGVRQTVTNLHQAISFLGFNQIRNLAITASVSEAFKKDDPVGPYRRSNLWRHMVSVGICARLVARRCGIRNFEDAFLAGLLHDLGLVLLDQVAHPEFCRVMQSLDPARSLCEVERDVYGFDHCQLGDCIGEIWRFPVIARAAIRHHHASHRYNGDGADVVRCVEVANVLCSLKGTTSVGMKLLRPPLEAFQALGFQKEDVVVLAHDMDQELTECKTLFEL